VKLAGLIRCWSSHTLYQNLAKKLLPFNQLPRSTTFVVFPLSKWKTQVRRGNKTITCIIQYII